MNRPCDSLAVATAQGTRPDLQESEYIDDDAPRPPASLRSAWTTWLLVTVALALYAFGAEVETRVESVPLVLTPGGSVEISVPRFFSNALQLDLELPCPPASPGDRATVSPAGPQLDKGFLKLRPEPGVRLEVSRIDDDTKSVAFETLPSSGACSGSPRRLTTNLAIAPGVYRWPPPEDVPSFTLEPGFNRLRIKIVAAEPPLVGRRTVLYAPGSIQLTNALPNVSWLWPALYLDLLFPVVQAIWLAVLIWRTVRRRAESSA